MIHRFALFDTFFYGNQWQLEVQFIFKQHTKFYSHKKHFTPKRVVFSFHYSFLMDPSVNIIN